MNKILLNVQKTTGIKQSGYDNEKNRLYNMCQMSIQMLNEIWKQIEKSEMKDEQFVLNWLDAVNEISIRN